MLLGAAFSTMTALLMIHGLATPGIIVGQNGVIALAGAASLPAGGAVLALTALPAMRRPLRLAPVLSLQAALAVAILLLGASACSSPLPSRACRRPAARRRSCCSSSASASTRCSPCAPSAPTRSPAGPPTCWSSSAASGSAGRSCRSWSSATARSPSTSATPWSCSGIVLVGIPAALDLRHGGASRPLVGDLAATELVGAEEAFLGPRVRALMVDLAAKDRSTEEHTRRVATLACAVGEELRLPPATCRHLAIGGLLHDMGKLRVAPASSASRAR